MSHSSRTCPDCGARLHAESTQCDLCGVPVETARPEAVPVTPVEGSPGPYCNECGNENPPGSRFCSQCGSPIVREVPTSAPASPEPSATTATSEPIGRQVIVLVGGALLIVLALFVVTLVSRQNVSTGGGESFQAPPSAISVLEESQAAPLDEELEARVAAAEEEIRSLQGEERLERQHQLVHVLVENGRPDRAAVQQQEIAEQTGQPDHWRDAGDLYFEWMELAETQHRMDIAQLTVHAYDRVLAHDPENYDVRANLAWALQYDTQNPMRAIDETNYILTRAPDHVQANFNRGYFLMRINRFDQAVEQMERVRELAGPTSPVGEQAAFLIDIIRSEQQRMRSGN